MTSVQKFHCTNENKGRGKKWQNFCVRLLCVIAQISVEITQFHAGFPSITFYTNDKECKIGYCDKIYE
jgi:hypothetical protein